MELTKSVFGKCPDGTDAILFTLLCRSTGAQVSLTNFGASIVSVKVPSQLVQPLRAALRFQTVKVRLARLLWDSTASMVT